MSRIEEDEPPDGTLCPSSYYWGSEAIWTQCERDLGHVGIHLELRHDVLYKWDEQNKERNSITSYVQKKRVT